MFGLKLIKQSEYDRMAALIELLREGNDALLKQAEDYRQERKRLVEYTDKLNGRIDSFEGEINDAKKRIDGIRERLNEAYAKLAAGDEFDTLYDLRVQNGHKCATCVEERKPCRKYSFGDLFICVVPRLPFRETSKAEDHDAD